MLDAHGRPQPAPNRSPSVAGGRGFGPLAAQVHGMGLRFGVHLMRGMPRQAVGLELPIAGSPWRCHEVADPGSTCAWNTDMCGLAARRAPRLLGARRPARRQSQRPVPPHGARLVRCDPPLEKA
ncbi:MAG TPA: hypothetical protein VF169_03605 [Albitalea sp.]|uniref:hypothetical protein n=1 Tax=Piscinibacter sp. TaxID=1903157 RepID=UPI002ED2132A